MQADSQWYVLSIGGVNVKVNIVYKDAIRRILINPLLDLICQSIDMLLFNRSNMSVNLYLWTNLPNIYPFFYLFCISSQSFSLCLSNFDHLPNTFRISILICPNFHYLHLLIFYFYQLINLHFRDNLLLHYLRIYLLWK